MALSTTFALMIAAYIILRCIQIMTDLDWGSEASSWVQAKVVILGLGSVIVIVIAIWGVLRIDELESEAGRALQGLW